MDDRWEKVGELFKRAQGLPEDERARFLDTNCGSDHELRAEVESLLNQLTDDFFDSPPHLAEGEAGKTGAFWASLPFDQPLAARNSQRPSLMRNDTRG